jgi:hypothetical protein
VERFEGWAAYNAACEPGREWRPGMPELDDLARHDQVQDAEDTRNVDYAVLFLPGGGSAPPGQRGNLVAWCRVVNAVVVLKRDTTLAAAQAVMFGPEPRLGTLQAIAAALADQDTG